MNLLMEALVNKLRVGEDVGSNSKVGSKGKCDNP